MKRFNLVSKIYLLFAFAIFFEIRIMNYLRAIDSPVRCFSLSVIFSSQLFRFFTLPNVFNNIKTLLPFVSLGDSGLSFTNLTRADLGR